VFSQQGLDKRNIVNPAELATYTPSLSSNRQYGTEKSSFSIRGFVQELGTQPSVAVYFADVVAPRSQGPTPSGNGTLPGTLFDGCELKLIQISSAPVRYVVNLDHHRDRVTREMVVADCDYVGAGYGLIDQGVIDALALAARTEGLLLDPVYSGKAMKGLIALSALGRFDGETVVFLHTGGAQGLFGYQSEMEGKL